MTTRRQFAFTVGGALTASSAQGERPNILWITCEDTGQQLGCYGDKYADTPNLDKLASQGMRYAHAWSNAPVCAPARTTIISGMYPPGTGSEHMRSMTRLPANMRMYPCYLRDAGYYCTNNSKEDYNLEHTGKVWDDSSNRAHWRNRKPGQPFFAIFNFLTTHESQIRTRPHKAVHDPAGVRVPAYHPDTPEVRQDWAQYYDNITTMDGQAAKVLRELEADGLADSTIVMFYGDHGSGMPRSKRWPYNSGLRVPLIAYFPEKFRHLAPKEYRPGAVSARLVSFVDLAPTVLSLAGVKPPAHMQGRAFLGQYPAPEPKYIYGFRGRMDERIDLVRSVTDGRYVYLRQFMPHKIYGQHVSYMFQTPTTRVWREMYDARKLNAAQRHFWERKPPEELFDLQSDPDEVNNLAGAPEHQATLRRMRSALREWLLSTRDVGFLPEHEIHARSAGSTPYEMGHNRSKYPFERVLDTAELASGLKAEATRELVSRLSDADSAVRYWAALGILMREEAGFKRAEAAIVRMLEDSEPAPRVVASEILARYGSPQMRKRAIDQLTADADGQKTSVYVAIQAFNVLDELKVPTESIRLIPVRDTNAPQRAQGYVPRLVQHITGGPTLDK